MLMGHGLEVQATPALIVLCCRSRAQAWLLLWEYSASSSSVQTLPSTGVNMHIRDNKSHTRG